MNDAEFQQPFERLREVHQEIAPTFGPMRTRASASVSQGTTRRATWAGATALLVVVLGALWFAAPWHSAPVTTPEQLEQLIAAIDQHLDARAALDPWQSPTDILLTSIHP